MSVTLVVAHRRPSGDRHVRAFVADDVAHVTAHVCCQELEGQRRAVLNRAATSRNADSIASRSVRCSAIPGNSESGARSARNSDIGAGSPLCSASAAAVWRGRTSSRKSSTLDVAHPRSAAHRRYRGWHLRASSPAPARIRSATRSGHAGASKRMASTYILALPLPRAGRRSAPSSGAVAPPWTTARSGVVGCGVTRHSPRGDAALAACAGRVRPRQEPDPRRRRRW